MVKKDDWVQFFENAVYEILARNNYIEAQKKLLEKESLVL